MVDVLYILYNTQHTSITTINRIPCTLITYGSDDCSATLNKWTVSVLLQAAKNMSSYPNARELMVTDRATPRWNSNSLVPSGTLNTLINVPYRSFDVLKRTVLT